MKEKKKNGLLIALGIAIGIILYKVVFELLWPMVFN
jgi:hypothetical protein